MSIQKLRYHQAMDDALKINDGRKDDLRQRVKLFDIITVMSKLYGKIND